MKIFESQVGLAWFMGYTRHLVIVILNQWTIFHPSNISNIRYLKENFYRTTQLQFLGALLYANMQW